MLCIPCCVSSFIIFSFNRHAEDVLCESGAELDHDGEQRRVHGDVGPALPHSHLLGAPSGRGRHQSPLHSSQTGQRRHRLRQGQQRGFGVGHGDQLEDSGRVVRTRSPLGTSTGAHIDAAFSQYPSINYQFLQFFRKFYFQHIFCCIFILYLQFHFGSSFFSNYFYDLFSIMSSFYYIHYVQPTSRFLAAHTHTPSILAPIAS